MLEQAVEQSIDGIAMAGMDGIIQFCNQTWATMHGYEVHEVLGKPLSIFHTKKQMREDVIPFNVQVKQTGSFQGEVGHLKKDGTTFSTWMTTTFLKDEQGNPIGLVGIARDITDRRRIEQALCESELQYRTTLDSMADAIHVVDEELRIIILNKTFRQWNERLGLAVDVVGKSIFDIFPFLPDKIRGEYKTVFKTGKILLTEEVDEIEGREIITETRKIPIFEGGKVVQVATIVRDVTQRKKTEEKVYRSEEKYRFLFEKSSAFSLIVGKDQTIQDINESSLANLGYSKAEVLGKDALSFLVADDKQKASEELTKALRGQPASALEVKVYAKNGSIHTILFLSDNVALYENTEFVGALFTGIDITERKKAEKEQIAMTSGLRAVVAAADELIACSDVETVFKWAVEFAREKLGLERCAIFLEEGGYVHGIYGTDRFGRTTDEHENRFTKTEPWKQRLRMLHPQDPSWVVVREPQLEWDGEKPVQIGEGWIVITPIQSAQRPIGVFVNDAAMSGTALDPMQQDTLAVLCSLLGNIIERKRAENKLEVVNKRLLQSNRRLKQLVLRDSHTGLFNHRFLEDAIEAEYDRAKRYGYALSVVMLDLDYFKSINDVYGHQFGDLILKQFSRQLKRLVRKYDIVIRFGGEEFIIISPGIDRVTSVMLAQRILDDINLGSFGTKEQSIKLKLSFAVASFPEDRISRGVDLINLADKILNRAKEDGGDRVCSSVDLKLPRSSPPGGKEKSTDVNFLQVKIEKLTKRANQSLIEAIFAFAKTIKLKDHYTGEHVESTVFYATEIARRLGLQKAQVENIRQAAKLHDLGKIGVSEKILLKRSKLTKKEFDEIKRHTLIGADILRPIHFLHDIIPLILYHHERWDGGGYPHGLKKEEIPIGARIVAVADAFQALISDRPYRRAFSPSKAKAMIKEGAGSQFDPRIVDRFLTFV
ncbi:PAS domain S-box protein [Candidatus Omnitrophota bacterium]